MTGRFALIEIKDKSYELYEEIGIEKDKFPEQDTSRMGIDTQFKLYKYLLLGRSNTKEVVPTHQKVFRFFVLSAIILMLTMFF